MFMLLLTHRHHPQQRTNIKSINAVSNVHLLLNILVQRCVFLLMRASLQAPIILGNFILGALLSYHKASSPPTTPRESRPHSQLD